MYKIYSPLIFIGNALQPFLLLAVRLFWGWQFFKAGFGKFENMEQVASFFSQLGFSYPLFSANVAALVECIGGLCLLIGLASRLVAIPLIFTMSVALVSAHSEVFLEVFANPKALIAASPFTYLAASLLIFCFGPGFISVDALIKGIKNSITRSNFTNI